MVFTGMMLKLMLLWIGQLWSLSPRSEVLMVWLVSLGVLFIDVCSCYHFWVDQTRLTSSPVLAISDFNQLLEVTCDACKLGIGASLSLNGRPVAFYSQIFANPYIAIFCLDLRALASLCDSSGFYFEVGWMCSQHSKQRLAIGMLSGFSSFWVTISPFFTRQVKKIMWQMRCVWRVTIMYPWFLY